MEKKYSVPKVSERQSYRKAKTEIRPLFNRMTALGAQQMRSPLVSMILPSLKTKTDMFMEENSKKEAVHRVGGVRPSGGLSSAGAQTAGMGVRK